MKGRLFACGLLLSSLFVWNGAALTQGQGAPQAEGEPALARAEVVRVVDGDTFDVALPNGDVERVRYFGIDAPSAGSAQRAPACFGPEAADFNARLLSDRTVWLAFEQAERDPRRAYVHLSPDGGALANAILLAQGFARLAGAPAAAGVPERFVRLAEEAREAGRGLWGRCRTDADGPLEIGLPLAAPRVVINEIDLNPPGADRNSEWVELYNDGESAVDVGGWVVVAGAGGEDEGRVEVPAGTSLDPGALVVLDVPGQIFGNEDETVELRDASNEVVDKTPALSDEWLACWARVPDGGAEWVERTCTRGAPNAR